MDPTKLAPYVARFKQLLTDKLKREKEIPDYYDPSKKIRVKRGQGYRYPVQVVPEREFHNLHNQAQTTQASEGEIEEIGKEGIKGPATIQELYAPPGDFTGKPLSPWARKVGSSPWAIEEAHFKGNSKRPDSLASKLEAYKAQKRGFLDNFSPARMTGRLRFKKSKTAQNLEALNRQAEQHDAYGIAKEDTERVTCHRQFREYCASTSLHGWRYLSEKKRSKIEQLFWLCWCLFGVVAAGYMMGKIWKKWERSPIITSVATTNYPVSSIVFPAVTICTVNKAATEKLIIQGCRYNFTLTQMRTIISVLVDPDARNNDHVNVEKNIVKPEVALKYLRLVAPKCDDYLLSCRWNNAPAQCTQMFRLVLTDTGYCCTFNAVETKKQRKDSKHDMEVAIQEKEYEFLQRAVWEYTDNFRSNKNSPSSGTDAETGSTTVDSFSCVREYDDDLFPGICQYLQKCRDSEKCRERNRIKSNATSNQPIGSQGATAPFNFFAESFPLKVAGAGRSRGLTLMLDTLRCDTVPTDSFKGLRVYVHNADDFPAVAERGYIVGPGMETQISVTAVDTYSGNVLRSFSATTRGCFFPDEFPLKFYKEYSRSACIVECETEFVNQECQCVTYFSPGNYSICTLKKYQECVKKALDSIQKKTIPAGLLTGVNTEQDASIFNFKSKKDREQEKSCAQFCLPSCNETFYNVFVTAADFPNQPQANQTKMLREAIIEGGHTHLNDIAYVSGSISVLRIFFRESSIMQYKRDELFTWEDFVSALGGVMSLCMGFSIISLVEIFYFFSFRMAMDRRKLKHTTTVAEIVN